MIGSLHERSIDHFVAQGWRRSQKGKTNIPLNWNPQLRKIVVRFEGMCDCSPVPHTCEEADICELCEVVDISKCNCRFYSKVIPDAFQFDYANKVVRALEVEDTSAAKKDKLLHYADLWWMFDNDLDWSFELWLFDVRDKSLKKFDFVFAIEFLEGAL